MSKRLILVLALAFVVAFSFAAYAEVQNVKVSGDITMMGISRNNIDLAKERSTTTGITALQNDLKIKSDDNQNAISIVRVRVDADLTDNVSTTVRLLNERVWGAEADAGGSAHVDIDLAYATLKEFLYSPLTMTVGRQELHFGSDFIVGDPDTNNFASTNSALPQEERDLSARKSFDALRATLNYDPLIVDVIWAKVVEGATTVNDDTTLSGINLNYALDKMTTLEGYFFSKIKDSGSTQLSTPITANLHAIDKTDKVFVVGTRVNNSSVKNLAVGLEAAFQFGTYNPAFNMNSDITTDVVVQNQISKAVQRRAWALEATANYDLKDVSMISKYAPRVGLLYVYLSGDNPGQKTDDKKWCGWDPMYENKTYGHLANAIFDMTNMSIAGINGKMKIVDDLSLNLDYLYYWLNKGYRDADYIYLKNVVGANQYRMTHGRHLGQELDAKLTYDYTEDVQFSLLAGIFVPGTAFSKKTQDGTTNYNRNSATEVIGSMKVTF